MHEIHPHQLWLGHALDIRNPQAIFDAGIRAVIDVAYEELPAQLPRQLVYCRFPLNDGGGNDPRILEQALRTLIGCLSANIPVLVGCSAGMSRSPTIAALALAKYTNSEPADILERIASIKSIAVNGKLWDEVSQVYSEMEC